MKSYGKWTVIALAVAVLLMAIPGDGLARGGGNKCTKYSQASLDLSTCGCETTMEESCIELTEWTLDKASGDLPDGTDFSFDVVVEDFYAELLKATGQIRITNGGEQTAQISSVILNLEEMAVPAGSGNGIGPSGQNWNILGTATMVPAEECEGEARTCHGSLSQTENASFTAFSPDDVWTLAGAVPDSDGDGLEDEDPICGVDTDGDGLVDEDGSGGDDGGEFGVNDDTDCEHAGSSYDDQKGECGYVDEFGVWQTTPERIDEDGLDDDGDGDIDEDGPCTEQLVYAFEATFDVTGMDLDVVPEGLPEDYLRFNVMVTFVGAGKRGKSGASCTMDVNCNGEIDEDELDGEGCSGPVNESETDNVRTVQKKHQFAYPSPCGEVCPTTDLVDEGAWAVPLGDDPPEECVEITSDTLEVTGLTAGDSWDVSGTVSCIECDPLGGFEDAAGATSGVTMNCRNPGWGNNHPSYWDCRLFDADSFTGNWDSWCVDTDHTLNPGVTYEVVLYSSYGPLPPGTIDRPENLDLVNWIINQDYTDGEQCQCRDDKRVYTYGEVQRAIWSLIEDNQSGAGLGPWTQCCVDEIVNAAQDDGEGFEPDCSQKAALIMKPLLAKQVNIAEMWMTQDPDVCRGCTPCEVAIRNRADLTCQDSSGHVTGSPAVADYADYFSCCETGLNAELVENGGFETPDITNAAGWDIWTDGEPGIGWTVIWGPGDGTYNGCTRPAHANLELQDPGVAGVPGYDGQRAELDTDWDGPNGDQSCKSLNGEPGNVEISQDLETCPGKSYTLSYTWRSRTSGDRMEVWWNGSKIAEHSGNTGSWITESHEVAATALTTTLAFEEVGTNDSLGTFLDSVSVYGALCQCP